jgi:hypothetical protein
MAVLRTHGICGVVVVKSAEDRVYCSDTLGLLEEACVVKGASNEWNDQELESTFKGHHPLANWTVREKAAPGLQMTRCMPDANPELYANGKMWEIDIDEFPPQHLSWKLFAHWWEVGRNRTTGKKTDYAVIARDLLRKRGIDVRKYELEKSTNNARA